MSSLDFSDYQNTDAREKNSDLSVEHTCASAVFLSEIFLEEIGLLVPKN